MVWVLAIVGIVLAVILSRVDDWSRDFSMNFARTDESSVDLKPLRMEGTPTQARDRVRRSVADLRNWQWIDETKSDAADAHIVVNLVRQTALFRFRDDIQVSIVAEPAAAAGGNSSPRVVINMVSRSRLGKGDLGQNPRNLKELIKKIKAE